MDRSRSRLNRGRALTFVCVATIVAVGQVLPSSQAATLGRSVASTQSADRSIDSRSVVQPTSWFVELHSPPTSDGTPSTQVSAEHGDFRREAARAKLSVRERHAFKALWNGLSVEVRPRDVGRLSRIPGVKAIYPIGEVVPEVESASVMTGAQQVRSQLGFTGRGVKVGIIDSGMDYHHPDLGGCFGPGCRVSAGWDFVGEDFNLFDPHNNIPAPDPDPDECGLPDSDVAGHGTHVAGIVGAKGSLTGLAPGVTFGAYRVFSCHEISREDIVLAAMERALSDGMDVVNMSIGASYAGAWPNHPWGQAADRLVEQGVVVVAAAGNNADFGAYSTAAPALGSKAISVASVNNSHIRVGVFTAAPDSRPIRYTPFVGGQPMPQHGTAILTRISNGGDPADACSPLAPDSLRDKVALIRRGACTYTELGEHAEAAGATGVVFYHDGDGMPVSRSFHSVPAMGISRADGQELDSRLATGDLVITWTDESHDSPIETAGLVSQFSSMGPSPDLALKPDIAAPGAFIRSTVPVEHGLYGTYSGTSMASPHVAGAVALLLEAKPKTPAVAVRDLLQNSADPRRWRNNPELGFLEMVHRQGAGMIDLDATIQSTTRVSPGKLELGESEHGPIARSLTIANDSASSVSYDLSHTPTLSTTGSSSFPRTVTGFASAAFSQGGTPVTTVTVPPRSSTTVDVTITANTALADRSIFGGYAVITPQDGGEKYGVPYVGVKGDYQSIRVLEPTELGFPWLAKLVTGQFHRQSDGSTYTMQGHDIPWVVARFEHQARRMEITIADAVTGQSWHRAILLNYMSKNRPFEAFVFPIDGTTTRGNRHNILPNGTYTVTVSVLKALGDSDNPKHTESWTSPAFTIARP